MDDPTPTPPPLTDRTPDEANPLPDYGVQIRRLRELLDRWRADVRTFRQDPPPDPESFYREIGLNRRGEGEPTVVIGANVGAELGHPPSPSHAFILTTSEPSLVHDGRVQCVGLELTDAQPEKKLGFAQVILASCNPSDLPDPFQLESTQYLANRLDGYMARTMPGRLWVRVSRRALATGFDLRTLGFALISAFRMDFPRLRSIEAVLITGEPERVSALDSIAAEAKVIGGRHRKLVYVEKGHYACDDLNCETCDERSTCDALKDVAVRYRKAGAA